MNFEGSIGIDLGTSNSSCAVSLRESEGIRTLPLLQRISPDAVGEQEVLPSALYLPFEGDLPVPHVGHPWTTESGSVIGEFARTHGALLPERLVLAAKSWLCNSHIDRSQRVLPWQSTVESKISPLEASTEFLRHLRENAKRSLSISEESLNRLRTILTVPASFDESARNLTLRAATESGWQSVTLLEEPLAAFYAWLAAHEDSWRKQLSVGDLVLVVDIGGGTSDFSLVAVEERDGSIELCRVSVGDHILLGGENMDLALAVRLKERLEARGAEVDHWQFLSLTQEARRAKEALLSSLPPSEYSVAVASRGSSLFKRTVSEIVHREDIETLLLDGFFPFISNFDLESPALSAGFSDFGLPYAEDPNLHRHLLQFLTQSTEVLGAASLATPTKVLFNGGVFRSEVLRLRLLEQLQRWFPEQEIAVLPQTDLELAVSRGAAFFGEIQAGASPLRVRAGVSRSYYLGLEALMPAVPGYRPPVRGLCVLPQGTDEGEECVIAGHTFGLRTGKAVTFRFFASNNRPDDALGSIVPSAEKELDEVALLSAIIPTSEGRQNEVIPVRLRVIVSHIGVLELWLEDARAGNEHSRWKLELGVRGQG